MNILFAIPNLEIGGAQTFLLRLASFLSQKGHKVFIYNIHPKKIDEEILNLIDPKVKLLHSFYESIELKLNRHKKLLKLFHYLFNREKFDRFFLNKLIKKHNIQVINSHMYLADLYISRLKLNNHIPKISSWHGCYNLLINDYQKKDSNLEILIKQTHNIFRDFSYIIFCAEKHKQAYKTLKLTLPFTKIYYGFPLPKKIIPERFDKKNNFIFGMIARGEKTKGWEISIKAFLSLKKFTNKSVKLILIGWSEYIKELSEKYQNDDIIFVGSTNNPLGWIYYFDVCLLPTYFPAESLPNSIIEYLSMGKPVIATNWAEIPQMLASSLGIAGFLVDVINGLPDITQLTNFMLEYINNPSILIQHSKASEKAFKKFSMEKCAESYIKLFKKISIKNS